MLKKRLKNNKKRYNLKPHVGDIVYILHYSENKNYLFNAIYKEPVYLVGEKSFTTQLNLEFPNWAIYPDYDFSELGESWFYTLEDAQRYILSKNSTLDFKQVDAGKWVTYKKEKKSCM